MVLCNLIAPATHSLCSLAMSCSRVQNCSSEAFQCTVTSIVITITLIIINNVITTIMITISTFFTITAINNYDHCPHHEHNNIVVVINILLLLLLLFLLQIQDWVVAVVLVYVVIFERIQKITAAMYSLLLSSCLTLV